MLARDVLRAGVGVVVARAVPGVPHQPGQRLLRGADLVAQPDHLALQLGARLGDLLGGPRVLAGPYGELSRRCRGRCTGRGQRCRALAGGRCRTRGLLRSHRPGSCLLRGLGRPLGRGRGLLRGLLGGLLGHGLLGHGLLRRRPLRRRVSAVRSSLPRPSPSSRSLLRLWRSPAVVSAVFGRLRVAFFAAAFFAGGRGFRRGLLGGLLRRSPSSSPWPSSGLAAATFLAGAADHRHLLHRRRGSRCLLRRLRRRRPRRLLPTACRGLLRHGALLPARILGRRSSGGGSCGRRLLGGLLRHHGRGPFTYCDLARESCWDDKSTQAPRQTGHAAGRPAPACDKANLHPLCPAPRPVIRRAERSRTPRAAYGHSGQPRSPRTARRTAR